MPRVKDYDDKIKAQLEKYNIAYYDFDRDSRGSSKYYMLDGLKSNMVRWELYLSDAMLHFSYGLHDSLKSSQYFEMKVFPIYKGMAEDDWKFISEKARQCLELDIKVQELLGRG